MPLYRQGAAHGDFDAGVRTALQGMLSSLHFIFRVEDTPSTVKADAIYRISDVDLASRLSFFLWGTIPDRELIDAAAHNTLGRPEVFDREVRRMLADPRAKCALDAICGAGAAAAGPPARSSRTPFPTVRTTTRRSPPPVRRETELLFDHVVRADRPMLELLTADYTFVNERLARHYLMQGVSGPEFRQVSYPDDTRRGLLGQGSILTLTSHGDRTSPVLRGKWVLEVLLGTPPPPPPPDVPVLEKTASAHDGKFLSVAEQLAQHRASPICSSCHNVIDPIGLALDHFDVTGAWRIKDRGVPVSTDGELYDGTKLHGVADLRAALLARSDVVVSHFTEMLTAYALGRRVEPYDMPTIRQILRDARPHDYRLSDLILGITHSAAFRTARAESTH